MIEVPRVVIVVHHAPEFSDDGMCYLTQLRDALVITPEEGINGHKGTWTTVHPVYYDETIELKPPENTTEGRS